MNALDSITLEVIRNRLESTTEEMQHTLLRSSVSVIVKEGEDCSCGLFDARGNAIAQACANPIHLGVMGPAIEAILARFEASTIVDGDVFIVNDPYEGGTHIPDLILVLPVFIDGELVAMSVALSHHEDMGGKTPGSMPADATEIFQEGLVIPPLKLYEAGRRNKTLFAMIEKNVRLPGNVFGDLEAELSCIKVGARAIGRTFEEFGRDTVLQALRELEDSAEARTRKRFLEIPDGTYRFEDFLDSDGIDQSRQLAIRVSVTVSGSEVLVDFTGTSEQVGGPVNIGYWGTVSSVACALRCITGPDIPSNAGCLRPVTVIVPEGSLLNPRHPAPVGIRAHTSKRVSDVVMGAIALALPETTPAASSGSLSVCSFSGLLDGDIAFGCTDLIAGGMGGRPGKDGLEIIETDTTNCKNVPAEALEASYPLRVLESNLRADTGGAGEFRGGVGVQRRIQAIAGPIRCSFRSERQTTQPWGMRGGTSGASYQTTIERPSGEEVELPSKAVFILQTGDVLRIRTGGGGGYGDPLARTPARVRDDVLDRKVSRAAARATYGVVLDVDGVLDADATRALRDEMRLSVATA